MHIVLFRPHTQTMTHIENSTRAKLSQYKNIFSPTLYKLSISRQVGFQTAHRNMYICIQVIFHEISIKKILSAACFERKIVLIQKMTDESRSCYFIYTFVK